MCSDCNNILERQRDDNMRDYCQWLIDHRHSIGPIMATSMGEELLREDIRRNLLPDHNIWSEAISDIIHEVRVYGDLTDLIHLVLLFNNEQAR